jgi:hypothetical protein
MMSTISARPRRAVAIEFVKIAAGFVLIYLTLERTATWTNSQFGEYGVLICGLVMS